MSLSSMIIYWFADAPFLFWLFQALLRPFLHVCSFSLSLLRPHLSICGLAGKENESCRCSLPHLCPLMSSYVIWVVWLHITHSFLLFGEVFLSVTCLESLGLSFIVPPLAKLVSTAHIKPPDSPHKCFTRSVLYFPATSFHSVFSLYLWLYTGSAVKKIK